MLITNIGVLLDWPAAYTPNAGSMDAFVLVQLKDRPGTPRVAAVVEHLRADLRARFPGVELAFDSGGLLAAALNMGEPAPIHVQVSGSKLGVMMDIAREVKAEIERVPGTADVRIAQRLDYPMIRLDIDRQKAAVVFLAMVALFRSWVDPLVVMLAIPLGLLGVALTLHATGTPMSVQVFMGLIMVVGIVVEYAIVLVDFANRKVHEGATPRDAAVEATLKRLRPIAMTSLTTLLALLPMALGLAGGDANVPLARKIVGGVLGATVLSLVVVPCVYVIAKRPGVKVA